MAFALTRSGSEIRIFHFCSSQAVHTTGSSDLCTVFPGAMQMHLSFPPTSHSFYHQITSGSDSSCPFWTSDSTVSDAEKAEIK